LVDAAPRSDSLASDDPAHCRIASQTVGAVDIVVFSEAGVDRSAQQTNGTVPAILARSAVDDTATDHPAQAKAVIEFPINEQANVGRDS
jgi:hypothetical protein